MRKTIITDDMLYSAAPTAENIIVESLDFDDGPDIVFSDEYRRNMDKIIKEQIKLIKNESKLHKKFGITNFMSKAAVFMMVFSGTMGVSLIAEADKGKLYEMLVQVEKRLTSLEFELDEENPITELVAKTPQYVPEGYVEERWSEKNNILNIVYVNGEGKRILYNQKILFGVGLFTDTEGTEMEVIVLNNKSLYYYFNKESSVIIWEDGHYKYSLRGDSSKEEFIKMVESIK